jgi:hypothetical protein
MRYGYPYSNAICARLSGTGSVASRMAAFSGDRRAGDEPELDLGNQQCVAAAISSEFFLKKNIMNCQHQPDNGHFAEAMRLGDRETVRIVSQIRQIDASIEGVCQGDSAARLANIFRTSSLDECVPVRVACRAAA